MSIAQSKEMGDVFQLQKVEFLECELKESRVREENLKKMNEALMNLVKRVDRSPLKEETIEELKRVNDQFASELKEVKRRSNAQQDALLSQISDLKKRNDDLKLSLKELQQAKDLAYLQLQETLHRSEAERSALQVSLQSLQSSIS